MKKLSTSTKVTLVLVVLLIGYAIGRQMMYARIAHVIAHEVPTRQSVAAVKKLILQKKLARVFKDATNHAKVQAVRTCQVFGADTGIVEIEGHHLSMAEAAAGAMVEFLSDLELPVRAAAADALGRMGKPAARPLLDGALNSPDKDVRSNGTKALQAIGAVAIPEMVEAVKSGKPTMRVGAAVALGRMKTPRAIDSLIGALGAKEGEVRLACRDALVAIGTDAVEPLIGALTNADPFTRRHSAEALGEIADKRSAEPLMACVGDQHRLVRLAAAYAVGKVKQPVATPLLISRLADPDREMREAAAVSLGQIADARAVPRLIALLQDPVDKVRESAAAALGRIRPSDPPALSGIELASRSGDAGVRSAAVLALGLCGNPASVGAVSARLDATREGAVAVRRRAAAALGLIGSPAGIAALLGAFDDPDWRVNYLAQDALAELGPPAVQPLIAVLGKSDALRARYARKALLKLQPAPLAALAAAAQGGSDTTRLGVAQTLADIDTADSLALLKTIAAASPNPAVQYVAQRAQMQSGSAAPEQTPAPSPPAEAAPPPAEAPQ
ncbi:MAG: HEAT repeat domain-containing protein [Armatimonadetes bacterium]|nr:HEAT repeat domain-containing protein [Armatimonadota bacterium]